MFCKKCGKDIDVNSNTCPNCGEETDFLKGIDGNEMPDHLKSFENEINAAFNGAPVEKVQEDVEYEDISSYTTSNTGFIPKVEAEEDVVEDNNITSSVERPKRKRKSKVQVDLSDTYDDDGMSNIWKIVAGGSAVVIVICLIIIFVVSCNSNKTPSDTVTSTTVATTTTTVPKTTVSTTTVPTTEKSVETYVQDAVLNDSTATQTAQTFYSNIEDACAKNDFDKFKTYFSSAYTEDEIQEIYNQYKDTCAAYETFIPGYTNTVSCDKYIYVYIAATTNATTGDYVENTFVLTEENGTFKVDGKTDGAKAYLQQAPSKIA